MNITETYQKQIVGVLSCYDRVILQASLSQWGYAQGITSFSINNNIKIFDFPAFAQSFRDILDQNILAIAKENNLQIEYILKASTFSKETNIQKIVSKKIFKKVLFIFTLS